MELANGHHDLHVGQLHFLHEMELANRHRDLHAGQLRHPLQNVMDGVTVQLRNVRLECTLPQGEHHAGHVAAERCGLMDVDKVLGELSE